MSIYQVLPRGQSSGETFDKKPSINGIDGFLERLYVTHTISRNEQTRGIFYWLGTKKGTEVEYVNPYDQAAIRIFDGLFPTRQDDSFIGDQYHTTPGALVQYRASVLGPTGGVPHICFAQSTSSFFGQSL